MKRARKAKAVRKRPTMNDIHWLLDTGGELSAAARHSDNRRTLAASKNWDEVVEEVRRRLIVLPKPAKRRGSK